MIDVLAGVNGAGKSSVLGAALTEAGAVFFNPDVEARALIHRGDASSIPEANSLAWSISKHQLDSAIANGRSYAFETTLGGKSITETLIAAASSGKKVRVRYVGLATAELHIARVKHRVQRGGHDIPEKKIRERFRTSRENLIRLIRYLHALAVFDNSHDVADTPNPPSPTLLLHCAEGRIQFFHQNAPEWAKPILVAAWDDPRNKAARL